MNKKEFLKTLELKTGYNEEKCILINDVLENNSLIGKKNKEKVVNDLIEKCFSKEEAEKIYEICSKIIVSEIKEKIKHPFKSLD